MKDPTKIYVAFKLNDLYNEDTPVELSDRLAKKLIIEGVTAVLAEAWGHDVDYSQFTVGMIDGLFVIQVPVTP